jgi:hypothetical protein
MRPGRKVRPALRLVARFHETDLMGGDPLFAIHDVQLHIVDVLRPAIAGRSAGPKSILPAVIMDSGLAQARAPE